MKHLVQIQKIQKSEEEGNKALPPGTIYCTKAEAYLRGLIDKNPLKEKMPREEDVDSGSEGGSLGSHSLWE